MKTLDVALGERSYPIHIGAGLLAHAGDLLAPIVGRRAIILTNATVAAHHLAPLRTALTSRGAAIDIVLVPGVESHKASSTLQDIATRMSGRRASGVCTERDL